MSTSAVLPPDAADRERISVTGLGETLFVEAGAGTGKTSQLVDRIVNLVLEHRIDDSAHPDGRRPVVLRDIAAITFTEAAAAELVTRVRVAFVKRSIDPETSSDHRQRCLAAIADADQAAISTVHGFASRILGEFPVAAGLPPRITVLDEVASELANEQRWERFVDRLHADPEHDELLYRTVLMDISLSPRYSGDSSFKEVAANFSQNWDRILDLATEPLAPLPPIDFAPFDAAVEACAAVMEACTDPSDKLAGHLEVVVAQMRAIAELANPHRKLRAVSMAKKANNNKGWGRGVGGKKASWSIPTAEVKDHISAVNDAMDLVIRASSEAVIDQLMRLTAHEVVDAAQARRAAGGLEFHDLLVLARTVLRENAEVRDSLHRRYRFVLLDEFQDTDPIQIELASLIAAGPSAQPGDTWKAHRPDPGRLFFVGDPKQSIYRFRRADIELFLDARTAYAGDDPVRLRTNFRTVRPIIDWVNGVFAEAMPDEVPNAQPRYEPLAAFRDPDSGADHRPVVLGGEHPDPKVKAGPLREAEANDVAAIIASIEADPAAWPVYATDHDGPDPFPSERPKVWRKATLSDITILIPTRTSLPYLREALERYRIRYRLATGTLVYDTQEVRDALATLRAIDDPLDALSLVAALRSPLFGCSDVDLFTYKHAGGRWDLRSKPPSGLEANHPVVLALDYLRDCWHERWWLGPANLLERVLRERSASLLAFGDPRPAEVWRRLRFLTDQARAFEESHGVDLRGFLEWASLQSAEGARVHEPLLPETDDDAVSILTVHGAKGLEFPITILSGMTTRPGGNRGGVSVLWGSDGPPEVKLKSRLETAKHAPRADLEEEMTKFEKLRLLYVAATRARDHLIVSGHHKQPTKDPNETFAGRLAVFAAEHRDLSRTVDLPDAPEPHSGGGPSSDAGDLDHERSDVLDAAAISTERTEWINARAHVLAPAARPTTVSATAIARSVDADVPDVDDDTAALRTSAAGDGATAPNGSTPEPGAARPILRRKGRAGSAIGRAVHATLEVVDFGANAADEPDDLDRQIDRQCDLEAISDNRDTVEALVRSALRSEAVELARRYPSYRELYVAAPLGADSETQANEAPTVVEGYVDLLIEGPTGLIIVDYKTDSVSTPSQIAAKVAGYELQGAAYAVALEKATGMPVVDCRFVFCNTGEAIEVSVEDLDTAKQRVRDTVGNDPRSAL